MRCLVAIQQIEQRANNHNLCQRRIPVHFLPGGVDVSCQRSVRTRVVFGVGDTCQPRVVDTAEYRDDIRIMRDAHSGTVGKIRLAGTVVPGSAYGESGSVPHAIVHVHACPGGNDAPVLAWSFAA